MILRDKFLRNGKRPAKTERARSDFQSWRRLFALVLVAINGKRDVSHHLYIKSVMVGNLLRAMQVLNIGFEDAVQNVVGRQAVLILLVGAKLRGRRLFDRRKGN